MSVPRYSESFLAEVNRFAQCNTARPCSPTEAGLAQFHRFESAGEKPDQPDEYYQYLRDGKAWWEWTLNFLASKYLTAEWEGWYAKALEYREDKGAFKQLRARCRCSVIDPEEIIERCESELASRLPISKV